MRKTALYPGEILTVPDFTKRSSRLRNALAPHIAALLSILLYRSALMKHHLPMTIEQPPHRTPQRMDRRLARCTVSGCAVGCQNYPWPKG